MDAVKTPREEAGDWVPSATEIIKGSTATSPDTPRSRFRTECHPLVQQISYEVDEYFLLHWPFPDLRSRHKFVAAGFSRVTCLYFPLSKNNRIGYACRLLTVLFLIDDLLEDMSFDDGASYNQKLMPLARGTMTPDPLVPVEYIMYDLWQEMRAVDEIMANDTLEPTFEFMQAQTDKNRASAMGLGEYFHYRERDVGRGLLSALMRFCMSIRLSKAEVELVREVDMNCSKHLAVVNDIWSFGKELAAAKIGHEEGAVLCSSVSIIAKEASISYSAAKRILYILCREWEVKHVKLTSCVLTRYDSASLQAYLKGLEYQMSGNEVWSRTTARYR